MDGAATASEGAILAGCVRFGYIVVLIGMTPCHIIINCYIVVAHAATGGHWETEVRPPALSPALSLVIASVTCVCIYSLHGTI